MTLESSMIFTNTYFIGGFSIATSEYKSFQLGKSEYRAGNFEH